MGGSTQQNQQQGGKGWQGQQQQGQQQQGQQQGGKGWQGPAQQGQQQQQGGKGWISPNQNWQQSDQGILGNNARGIAGSNPMLDYSAALTAGMGGNNADLNRARAAAGQSMTAGLPQLGAASQTWMNAGTSNPWEQTAANNYASTEDMARRRISGETIANDPAVNAAIQKFQTSTAPMIQSAAGLAGLGDSTAMTNALSAGQAQMMLPLVQEASAREERGLQSELASAFQRGAGFSGLGGTIGSRGLSGAQGLFGLGNTLGDRAARGSGLYSGLQGQGWAQMLDQINQSRNQGLLGRQMTQEEYDAAYNDFLRRSGLFERSTFGPMDAIPGTYGSTAEGKK